MKLHEAVIQAQGHPESWFRPAAWEGTGQAYMVKEGATCKVPSSRGGVPDMTTSPELLAGEWEIISPTQVLAERDSL